MNTEDRLFIYKYQPIYFKDFGEDNQAIKIIKTFISIDNLLILLFCDFNKWNYRWYWVIC